MQIISLSTQKMGHQVTKRFCKRVGKAVKSILICAAENVEVLELTCPPSIAPKFNTAHPVSFPRLSELTTHGDYLLGREGSPVIFGPCLRRLHIVHCETYTNCEFWSIGSFAPSLTHLHISGLQQEPWFVVDLEVALGIREESPMHSGWYRRLPTARLPLSVQKVFVKPAALAPTPSCGTHAAAYEDLLQDLYILNNKEDLLVLLKEQDELMSSQNVDESDWLNRIVGGEGCWDVSERIPKG
jgi:hypothetical protein